MRRTAPFYNAYHLETWACFSLHVKAKQRRIHVVWFHKHKIEPKYVWIRLEMLSNTYILVKSVEMNIFHVNSRRGALCLSRVGEWVTQRDPPNGIFCTGNPARFRSVPSVLWPTYMKHIGHHHLHGHISVSDAIELSDGSYFSMFGWGNKG